MKKVYLTLFTAAALLVACGPASQENADAAETTDKVESTNEETTEVSKVEEESQANVKEATELAEDTTSVLENSPVLSEEATKITKENGKEEKKPAADVEKESATKR